MKKTKALLIGIILLGLVFTPVLGEAEETKVPFEAVKSSCYGKIDMSKAEFNLVEVGKECVTEEWLQEHQILTEEEKETSEEGKEKKEKKKEKPEPLSAEEIEKIIDELHQKYAWNLLELEVPEAWKLTMGEGITVAVIDSGIDSKHEALQDSLWTNEDEIPNNNIDDDKNEYVDDIHGWDFVDDDNSSVEGSEITTHGTSVGGIIAGKLFSLGLSGVAPRAQLMDLRFLNEEGRFEGREGYNDFAEAINYARKNGADIINLSIYTDSRPPVKLKRAIERAREDGVILIGAAGDSNKSQLTYPGRYEEVIAVTAIDSSKKLVEGVNISQKLDFSAPGRVYSAKAYSGRGFIEVFQSSFAAPHASGTIALMLSINPDLKQKQVYEILKETAEDLGPSGKDKSFGWGLIDTEEAVKKAKELKN